MGIHRCRPELSESPAVLFLQRHTELELLCLLSFFFTARHLGDNAVVIDGCFGHQLERFLDEPELKPLRFVLTHSLRLPAREPAFLPAVFLRTLCTPFRTEGNAV